jgi:hypothetical protein
MSQSGSLFYNESGNGISVIDGKKKYHVYEITYIKKHGASSDLTGIHTS